MTKVSDKYLEEMANKSYVSDNKGIVVHDKRAFVDKEVVQMAEELIKARSIIKKLKQVSASRSYSRVGNANSGGILKAQSASKAVYEVLDSLPPNFVSFDYLDGEDGYSTVIASVYVLEKE